MEIHLSPPFPCKWLRPHRCLFGPALHSQFRLTAFDMCPDKNVTSSFFSFPSVLPPSFWFRSLASYPGAVCPKNTLNTEMGILWQAEQVRSAVTLFHAGCLELSVLDPPCEQVILLLICSSQMTI